MNKNHVKILFITPQNLSGMYYKTGQLQGENVKWPTTNQSSHHPVSKKSANISKGIEPQLTCLPSDLCYPDCSIGLDNNLEILHVFGLK